MKFVLSTIFVSAMAAGVAAAGTDETDRQKKRSSITVTTATTHRNKDRIRNKRALYHGNSATIKAATVHHESALPQKTQSYKAQKTKPQIDPGIPDAPVDPKHGTSSSSTSTQNTIDPPNYSCPFGQYNFVVEWSPDDWPEENTWTLEKWDGYIEVVKQDFYCPEGDYCQLQICLAYCTQYDLHIYDTFGDGISETSRGSNPSFKAVAYDYGQQIFEIGDDAVDGFLSFSSESIDTWIQFDANDNSFGGCQCMEDEWQCDLTDGSCEFCCSGRYTPDGESDWCAACGDSPPPFGCEAVGDPVDVDCTEDGIWCDATDGYDGDESCFY